MSKLISGILAVLIYLGLLYLIVIALNREKNIKNYVEKDSQRVSVVLVNSDRTIFNRKDKKTSTSSSLDRSTSHLVPSKHPIAPPIKSQTKKSSIVSSSHKISNSYLKKKKKAERLARIKKERERKKRLEELKKKRERERLARVKREKEKKRLEELKRKKEAERLARIKKERERKKRLEELKKKKERERLARIKREREQRQRERARSLFSSIPTQTSNSARIDRSRETRIRHNQETLNRIKRSELSGRVGNKNRERGVVNGYIARVKRQLNNWTAQSEFKGHSATIMLTIYSNGHFRYRVKNSTSVALTRALKRFLKQLNRIGLGEHTKSSPYMIEVTFRAK